MRWNCTLIGESFVGKTTIASAMMKIEFTSVYRPTIGASMVKIPLEREGRPVRWFYIWDTAGQEKYKALAPVYYRDSRAALVVYDVSERKTFEKLDKWLRRYRDSCGDANPVIVIGNKIDGENKRVVETSEGSEYAMKNKCQFMEVSAKTGAGIGEILVGLDDLLEGSHGAVQVSTQPALRSKQKCCG
jgi:Ras-related protein Rab-5C